MANLAISTEGLTRTFGNTRAVDDLSFEVPAGIVFGFLGPNGSGKTTTIRLLLGILEPTSGRAQVLGYDVQSQGHEVRLRSGALLEHSGLYEQLSAEDNLEFYGRVWRLPSAERKARCQEALTRMGLWERRKERVGAWSRGMKQKLAVARALLHRPSMVFLDEPTAGLDPLAAAALRDDLEKMVAREGLTVFLTTHNLAEAERLCQRVAVIRQGRLIAVGSPDELRARSGALRVEIIGHGFGERALAQLRAMAGVTDVATHNDKLLLDLEDNVEVAPLVSLLVREGARVEEVRKGKASLEEAFLALMEEER
ncbi:MAG: ATP-binding cassette domain-containing protein [Chloroflexota bacterium]